MTIGLLIALVLIVLALVVLADRKDARVHTEREQDRQERQTLLQRIQAPQVAVVDHSQQQFSQDVTSFPLSDEEIAAQQERDAALAFIERFESPGGDA